jgi:hypothetical protein
MPATFAREPPNRPDVAQLQGEVRVIRRRLAILVTMALALGGCVLHTYGYRYRLTLVVNDNGKLYSGSSVVGVKTWNQGTLEGSLIQSELIGQATVVDLGHGRLLVGLLSGGSLARPKLYYEPTWGDDPTSVLQEAYGLKVGWPAKGEPNIPALAQQQGSRNLAPEKLPTLVAFQNSQDPAGATAVDPRDLTGAFGSGVYLQRATIEITDDPITTGISRRLPWLIGLHGRRIDGKSLDSPHDFSPHDYQLMRGVR